MIPEAKAYLAWKFEAPEGSATSAGFRGASRRRRAYVRDHEWLLGDGARVALTERFEVPARCAGLSRGTPEEAFVAAIASSHMLAFLAIAAELGATVATYDDQPSGILVHDDDGPSLIEVVLRPRVTYGEVPASPAAEEKMHEEARHRAVLGNAITAKVNVYPQNAFVMAPR